MTENTMVFLGRLVVAGMWLAMAIVLLVLALPLVLLGGGGCGSCRS